MRSHLAALLIVGSLLAGCGSKEPQEVRQQRWAAELQSTPVYANAWNPEETFRAATPVTKISGTDISTIVVTRVSDGQAFKVLVVPFRIIPIGSRVEIVRVQYQHSVGNLKNLYFVR